MRTLGAALLSFLFVALVKVPALAADAYEVDAVHSAVVFKVKHLGVSNARGRFNAISGSIAIDDADPSKSAIQIEVKADSVDTANAKRDQHLKSPDFLSVKEFPTISFKSKSVKKLPDGKYEVAGEFTLHGVTKSVTVKVEKTGSGKSPVGGGELAGYETIFTIKRSDYGMKNAIPAIGDEIELTISIEAIKK
jgi:polyisoprenoid-binding protein YceI